MKVSNWDNGLTAEQQAEMDAKWEKLLAQVKKINPKGNGGYKKKKRYFYA